MEFYGWFTPSPPGDFVTIGQLDEEDRLGAPTRESSINMVHNMDDILDAYKESKASIVDM